MKLLLTFIILTIPAIALAQTVIPAVGVTLSIKEVAALVAVLGTIVGSTWKLSGVLNKLSIAIVELKGVINSNAIKLEALESRVDKLEDK